MPKFDVTAARREIDAGREPVELVFNDKTYVFPAALPAAVEIAQMELQRELRNLPDGQQAPEQTDKMMRACFGEHFDELSQTVGTMDLVVGMGWLMAYWSEPFQDPTVMQGLMAKHGARLTPPSAPAVSSNSASSTSTPSSKRTSNASTGSTSPGRSSANGSAGDGSSLFTEASQAKR